MVIENPMQVTIVNDVPLEASGAFCATNVENKGESAITTHPQKNRNPINTKEELFNNNSGERIQQVPDTPNEIVAIFFAPKICEIDPLRTQARLPDPIIRNDKRGMFRSTAG